MIQRVERMTARQRVRATAHFTSSAPNLSTFRRVRPSPRGSSGIPWPCKLVRTAERADEQGDQHRHQCLDAVHELAVNPALRRGLSGRHDLFGLIDQQRDKPQGDRHHHGKLMHRQVQLGKGFQQRSMASVSTMGWWCRSTGWCRRSMPQCAPPSAPHSSHPRGRCG